MYMDDHTASDRLASPAPTSSASSVKRTVYTPLPAKTATPAPTEKPTSRKTATPRPDPTPVPTPMASMGSRGDDVVEIQQFLIALDFLHDDADGIYGKLTTQAVRDFQETHNLPVTGEVDPATYRSMLALYKLYEAKGIFSSGKAAVPSPSPPAQKVASVATAKPKATATAKPAPAFTTYRDTVPKTVKYILNKNTHKFHKPSCSDVKKIAPKNYWEYNGTYDDVIAMGYKPCGHCHPK